MAFISRIGNLIKQSGGNHVNAGLSSSNSSLFQVIRCMSSAKVFVGGLAYSTDEIGLKEAFQQYGEVVEVKIIGDRDSGRSRGFGFVSFTSTDSANAAIQDMNGKELHGRRLRVNFALDKPRPAFGGGGGFGGGGYGGGGAYGGGYGGGGGGSYGGGYGGSNVGGYGGGGGSYNASAGASNLFGGDSGAGGGFSSGELGENAETPYGGKEDGLEDDFDQELPENKDEDDHDGDYAKMK